MSIESNVSWKLNIRKRNSDLCDKMAEEFSGIKGYQANTDMITEGRSESFGWVNKPQESSLRMSVGLERSNSKKELSGLTIDRLTMGSLQEPVAEVKEPVVVKFSCKCVKSKCLQLYCECFSKGVLCGPECTCYQCRNNQTFREKLDKARNSILSKDPEAFSTKIEIVGNADTEVNLAYKRGCNCKRAMCVKKYCECFLAGLKCTYLCKCQNCLNGAPQM